MINPSSVVTTDSEIAISSFDGMSISIYTLPGLFLIRTFTAKTQGFLGMIYSKHDHGQFLYTLENFHRDKYFMVTGLYIPYALNYTPQFIDSNPKKD